MFKYKTAVTDYEGMQSILDAHTAQGWRLFSVTPDTWRKNLLTEDGGNSAPFEELSVNKTAQEYSASYYLLVFQRDERLEALPRQAAAEENLPFGALPPNFFEE